MIEVLTVRDFALVEELSLEFGGGFTVLTGETGAGKSILLQALGLLLGERAHREGVRSGADQARVEGAFCPQGAARAAVAAALAEAGIAWADGEPLLVARTVGADGRSRAHVNGALAPLALVERVGRHLVEISSQHQHQGLLREETHLPLLDTALSPGGKAARAGYRDVYETWSKAHGDVRRLEAREAEARERLDFLRFQVDELRAAHLQVGEEDRLRAEREVLLHAGKLVEAYGLAQGEVQASADSALDRLGRATRAVESAARKDPAAVPILALLADAKAALEEAALVLRDRRDGLEADPRRLDEVEERLETIRRFERKHGAGTAAVLAKLEALERDVWELENREVALEAARARLKEAEASVARHAGALHAARREAASLLEGRVGEELTALALGRSAFQVEVVPGEPGPDGADAVSFLLAPNPGEAPRPLARIASGGELSRILLALKNALRGSAVETLIFDEVDAGIGGAVADAVADRLASLAATCQVVCITHLPQIASRAARHLLVEKASSGGRTVTSVRLLDKQDRVGEIARMLSGRHITETTLEHARELVERFAT